MSSLSVFLDESGIQEGASRYYLVTLVLHEQSKPIADAVQAYETSLATRGLPDIPFHATPLMRAHDDYESMDVATRKRLLASFGVLVQRLPISYKTLTYSCREFEDAAQLRSLIRRDLTSLLNDNLPFFQRFDKVKVYYDKGQPAVRGALRESMGCTLATGAVTYRNPEYRRFRLAQAADYLCAIELAAVKYASREETETDVRFFGGVGAFKKNHLKQVRRKLFR